MEDEKPVRLLEYSGRDLLAYAAALYMNKPDTENFDRVLKIIGRREDSVLEFSSATFLYSTSLVVRDHLMRYRTASFAAAGLRYNEPQDFVIPPEADPVSRLQIEAYYRMAEQEYRNLRDDGLRKEAARYLLPCGVRVRYLIRWNFRTLAKNFFPERLWGRGVQAETRDAAKAMWELLFERDPELWTKVAEVYAPR